MPNNAFEKLHAWLIGVAILGVVVTYILFVRSHWMPTPNAALERYVCPDTETVIFYHHHANTLRIETSKGVRVGAMHYNDIDWGDYQAASTILGVHPPLVIQYGDVKTVRLGGGQFDNVECRRESPQH